MSQAAALHNSDLQFFEGMVASYAEEIAVPFMQRR